MSWFPDVAAHKGLRASRVLSVRGLTPFADYYLVELTDPAGWHGLGKVSLEGDVLAGAETPTVRVPSEGEVLALVARCGHRAAGHITWMLVAGPPAAGCYEPFLPLAAVPTAGGTAYVNYRLQVFVDDPQGSIAVRTKAGILRLREIMPAEG
jgi:hypothetical protein